MESDCANKIIVEPFTRTLRKLRFAKRPKRRAIKKGLAKNILRYKLGRNNDEFIVGDTNVWEKKPSFI